MSTHEAVMLNIMTIHGYAVTRVFTEDAHSYWQAVGEGEIVKSVLGVEDLFFAWCEMDSVLRNVFRANVQRAELLFPIPRKVG